jgi:glycosyltransferase involved in cell wall biosynthesis
MAIEPAQVTILLPTLNEAECIEEVLGAVPADYRVGVLVIDGGSTDGTVEIVRRLGFRVIAQEGSGLGRAIATGIARTTGAVILAIDSDGAHEMSEIPRMVAKIDEGYDVVIGSRYSDGPPEAWMWSPRRRSTSADDTVLHAFGNRLFTSLCRLLFGVPVHDVLMGFKAFRREVFDTVKIDAAEQDYDVEVLLRAHKAGFRITDLPTVEHRRIGGASKLRAGYHGLLILRVIAREFLFPGPRAPRRHPG